MKDETVALASGRVLETDLSIHQDTVTEALAPVAEAAAGGSNDCVSEQLVLANSSGSQMEKEDGKEDGCASPRAPCQQILINAQSAADHVQVKQGEAGEQHLPGRLFTESDGGAGNGTEHYSNCNASEWISAAAVNKCDLPNSTVVSDTSDKSLPCGFVGVPKSLHGKVISLEMVDAAIVASPPPEACTREICTKFDTLDNASVALDMPVPHCDAGIRPFGVATNGLFICYTHVLGTSVQVVYQPSMSTVASLESGGTKVVDFDLQAEDSHLLTAFADGRVVVFQLSAENAAPHVLLKFRCNSVRGVQWHPMNPSVFLTMHDGQILFWHLQLIMQFSKMRLPGYEPLEEAGVQTALQVNAATVESAACEALPVVPSAGGCSSLGPRKLDLRELQHGETTPASKHSDMTMTACQSGGGHQETSSTGVDSPLSCTAISPDGQYLAASTRSILWLWKLRTKDDQTAPTATCVQRLVLPECLDNDIVHMRLVPRCASDENTVYMLMAVAGKEVLFWTLDPRPSGGTGYWLPHGKLLCPVQQRLRFPCPVRADMFQSTAQAEWPVATLVVALETHAGLRILSGNLTDGENGHVVPLLAASHVSHGTTAGEHWSLVALCGLDRPAHTRVLADAARAHAWAVIMLTVKHDSNSMRCQCIAMSQVQSSKLTATKANESTDLAVQAAMKVPLANPPVCTEASVAQERAGATIATDAAQMRDSSGAKAIIGHGVRRSKKMDAKDSDPLTPGMIRHLAHFMKKRTLTVNAKIVESVSRKLPGVLAGNHGGAGRRKPVVDTKDEMLVEHRTQDMLRNVIRESMQVIDQISVSEKAMVLSLKKACDPELMKQGQSNRQLKEAIERELARWRDSTFSKVVLKAAESRAFADQFADSLQAGHPEMGPLLEALRPPKQQLQEALQADLVLWCGGAIARRLKGLFQDTGFLQATRSIQSAMKETSLQAQSVLDRTLQETLTTVDTKLLSDVCAQQVVMAVRREVEQWEAGFRCPQQPPPPRPAAAFLAEHNNFLKQLRDMVAPLHQDLRDAAHVLESAAMETKEAVKAAEADSTGHTDLGVCQEMSFSRHLDEVHAALDAGRNREAFDQALSWDSLYMGAASSLVELACDYLRRQETSLQTEDLLEVPGCLKMHLSHVLLQRSILETAKLERIEDNVDLALALLQAVHLETEEEEQRVVAAFKVVEEDMSNALEQLRRGDWPPSLAAAEPALRRRVAATARMAVKGLSVLKHARGS